MHEPVLLKPVIELMRPTNGDSYLDATAGYGGHARQILTRTKNYTDISNEELVTMLENKDDYQFIDVRTTKEYYDEHVPGFYTVIDYYILEDDYIQELKEMNYS